MYNLHRRILHLTDLHLSSSDEKSRQILYDNIRQLKPLIIFITGDIGNSTTIKKHLQELILNIDTDTSVYYVLGNHDYYYSSVDCVINDLTLQYHKNDFFNELLVCTPMWVKEISILNNLIIGVNNFPDGRCGDLDKSEIFINDYSYIEDYVVNDYKEVMKKLGKISADQLDSRLNDHDLYLYDNIVVLMHTPPFRGAALHNGMMTMGGYEPHMVNVSCGEVLEYHATKEENKNTNFVVLCGHSHSQSVYDPLQNLTVYTGGSYLGHPNISGVISLDCGKFIYERFDKIWVNL
jgi:3',5'-cyclic AMP phosphodiesterase CpdA